jgi:F0F1-type ATP synthase assembly protein I
MRVVVDLVYNKVVGNLIIFLVPKFNGFRPYGLGVIVV